MDEHKARKYMGIVEEIAKLSKDKSTKVGALILGPNLEPRSFGYNGAPRGCSADEDLRGNMRPEKYFWYSHGELNAITNAARVGVPVEGCSLLVTHPPCMDCSRAIVQAGIKQVFVPDWSDDFSKRWHEHIIRSRQLFEETGVEFHVLKSN
jgi:dCMP deaminase